MNAPFAEAPDIETLNRAREAEVEALLRLAGAVEFDPSRELVQQAIWQAWHEHPGRDQAAAYARLQAAGRMVGLRVQQVKLSVEDARRLVLDSALLVHYDPTAEDGGIWRALDRQALTSHREVAWLDRVAGGGLMPGGAVEWLMADCAAPCQPASAARDDGHGADGHRLSPVRRLLALLWPDRADLAVVVVFAIGVGLLTLATPIAVQNLVNTVALGGLLQPVLILSLLLFTCLAFAAAFLALQTYVVELLQRRIFVRVVADLAYRLPRARYQAFEAQHGPELVNRFFDVLTVQKAGASLILDGLAMVLQAGIGMLVLAFYHPFLLGFDIVLLATIAFIVFGLGRSGVRTSIQESLAKYRVAGWLEEMVRHPLAFKLAGGVDLALRRADALTIEYLGARSRHFQVLMRQILFALGLQAVASTVLLGLGGWLVVNRQLTLGQLVAAELIVTLIVGSFAKMGKHLENFYDLMAAVDKLGHLLDLPLEPRQGEAAQRSGPARLTCRGMALAHGVPAAGALRFEIESGECVAILGEPGSGKTALADALFGLWTPSVGELRLDGLRTASLRPEVLRREIAVARGLEVFDGSVLDNVLLARHELSIEAVRDALRLVGLEDSVERLPQGLYTRLVTGGFPLSEEQVRSLVLARAVAGRPRLLVIDSLLDGVGAESAARLLRQLRSGGSWTLLVLTRRADIAALCGRTISLPWQPASDGPAPSDDLRSEPMKPVIP